MIKLVIGFDECGIDYIVHNEEAAFDKICEFLDNQFPMWDNGIAFDLDNIEFDYTNCEAHIPYNRID